MKFLNSWRQLAATLCVAALLTPPVDAHTRKGDKLLKEGQKAEAAQDYDKALTFYEQALQEDPREPAYQLAAGGARQKSSNQHIAQGRMLVSQQKFEAALVQFQKALLTDPSSSVALQLVLQTDQMIKEKAKAPDGSVILTPAERQRRDTEERINSLEGPPVLRPITNQLSNLKFNNSTSRVIYESIGKLAGINVLFDPAGIDTLGSTTRNFNLDLNNATLEEALQYTALVTHTFWKPISRNAIFVTQESEPKRQEYQDEVVKVFYVQNASTANEFTEIFNGVRIGAKLTTGIFQVASQNAIIARGSPDTMALVEKLVHDLDRPKAEVLIDIKVWEVSSSKVLNLGAALTGLSATNPLTLSPGTTSTSTASGTTTTTTTGSSIALSQIGKLSTNNFSLALPGAIAEAMVNDSNTRLLQNPQVRVTDGGKGSLKIGSKIPYVSGSLNSAVATPGSIPYATTQFQQIDVGVNVDVQPHVNGPNDVSMHIKVEISTVTSTQTIAGVAQPVIGQKVSEADVRMRDGEYTLLGGLTMDSDQQSVAGLPGLASMPVLGYLFGTRTKDREKDDILIALVPHIIRAQPVDEQLADGVLAGTEKMVRVEHRAAPATAPAPIAPAIVPGPNGTKAVPQLPPPGGTALMLAPTNNPKLPAKPTGAMSASSLTPPRPPQPAPRTAPVQQQPVVSQPATAAAVVSAVVVPQAPPGTEVTPLEGMQQMGLAPDPSSDGDSSPGLTAGQDLQQPVSTDSAPVQIAPEAGPAAEQFRSSQPISLLPLATKPDSGSYAVIGPAQNTASASTIPQKALAAAVAKDKTVAVPKVHLASTTTTVAPAPSAKTAAATPPPSTPAAAAAKPSTPPVQLLEGHLTQDPDSSSTTTSNPKQPK